MHIAKMGCFVYKILYCVFIFCLSDYVRIATAIYDAGGGGRFCTEYQPSPAHHGNSRYATSHPQQNAYNPYPMPPIPPPPMHSNYPRPQLSRFAQNSVKKSAPPKRLPPAPAPTKQSRIVRPVAPVPTVVPAPSAKVRRPPAKLRPPPPPPARVQPPVRLPPRTASARPPSRVPARSQWRKPPQKTTNPNIPVKNPSPPPGPGESFYYFPPPQVYKQATRPQPPTGRRTLRNRSRNRPRYNTRVVPQQSSLASPMFNMFPPVLHPNRTPRYRGKRAYRYNRQYGQYGQYRRHQWGYDAPDYPDHYMMRTRTGCFCVDPYDHESMSGRAGRIVSSHDCPYWHDCMCIS